MKNIKTIPFNWDTYQSDKDKYTLVTRDGREVTELIRFSQQPENGDIMYGLVRGEVFSWDDDGSYFSDIAEHNREDLMLEYEEKVVGSWVNIHQDESGQYLYVGATYSTMKEAMKYTTSEGYVTTINLNDIVCK